MNNIRRQLRRAVSRLRKGGLDGPEPVAELQFLGSHRDDLPEEMRQALGDADPADLAPTIRIARLLRCTRVKDDIADAALRRPAPLEARQEAVEALSEWGVDIPAPVAAALATADGFLADPSEGNLRGVLELPDGWRDATLQEWVSGRAPASAAVLQRIMGISPELDAVVIDRLGGCAEPAAVEILSGLEADADPVARKRIRKSLHRLRAAGIEIAEDEPAAAAFSFAITPDTVHEAQAYVTGVDGDGGRIVWVMAPTATGGDSLLEAVVDTQVGLRKAEVLSVRRSDLREHFDRLRTERSILVAKLPAVEVASLLSRAEKRSQEGEGPLPEAFEQWKQQAGAALLQVAEEGAERDALATLDPEAAAADRELLRESVSLLADPAFANWAVAGPSAQEAAEGVRSAETSKILVDEEQRKQAVDDAISGAAEIFDDELRASYRERLRSMARVLQVQGRDDTARACIAAAQGFVDIQDLYADHPFARALIQRGVLIAYQVVRDNEPADADSSPIIQP